MKSGWTGWTGWTCLGVTGKIPSTRVILTHWTGPVWEWTVAGCGAAVAAWPLGRERRAVLAFLTRPAVAPALFQHHPLRRAHVLMRPLQAQGFLGEHRPHGLPDRLEGLDVLG